jgi:hypothetical protein
MARFLREGIKRLCRLSPVSAISCYTLLMPTFRYEISPGRKSAVVICGVDEAGAGRWQGRRSPARRSCR